MWCGEWDLNPPEIAPASTSRATRSSWHIMMLRLPWTYRRLDSRIFAVFREDRRKAVAGIGDTDEP